MRFGILVIAAASLAFTKEPATFDQALNLYNHTDFSGAASVLRQIQKDPQSLELLGRCYLMDADYGKAIEALQKAVELAPGNSMTLTWLGRAYAHKAEVAFPLAAVGLANKARDAFEKAVQLDPSNGEAIDDLFEFYVQAPPIIGGGHEKARNLLPLITKIDPAQGQFASAQLAEASKLYSHAESHLRRALQISPKKVGRLLDLASFLSRRGRFEESDQTFEKAAALAPGEPRVDYAHAQALVKANRNLAEARDLLNRYIAAPNRTADDPPVSAARRLLRKAEGS